jgi:hypothetical protein
LSVIKEFVKLTFIRYKQIVRFIRIDDEQIWNIEYDNFMKMQRINTKRIVSYTSVQNSLAVGLGFGQKFKPDPRVGQIRQPNPRVGQPEPEETEPVTYNFLGFGQKSFSKPESWTEILVQPEDWIGSGCPTCPKPNPAATLVQNEKIERFKKVLIMKLRTLCIQTILSCEL